MAERATVGWAVRDFCGRYLSFFGTGGEFPWSPRQTIVYRARPGPLARREIRAAGWRLVRVVRSVKRCLPGSARCSSAGPGLCVSRVTPGLRSGWTWPICRCGPYLHRSRVVDVRLVDGLDWIGVDSWWRALVVFRDEFREPREVSVGGVRMVAIPHPEAAGWTPFGVELVCSAGVRPPALARGVVVEWWA